MTTFFWTITSPTVEVQDTDQLEAVLAEWKYDEDTIHYDSAAGTLRFEAHDRMNTAWGDIQNPDGDELYEITPLLEAIAPTLGEKLPITVQCTRGQVNIYQHILTPDGTVEHNSITQP